MLFLSAEVPRMLARFVSSSRTLKELRLFDNHILKVQQSSVECLYAARGMLPSRYRNLRCFPTSISCQDGGAAIGSAVEKCTTLKHLDLGARLRPPPDEITCAAIQGLNEIGDPGAVALAKAAGQGCEQQKFSSSCVGLVQLQQDVQAKWAA